MAIGLTLFALYLHAVFATSAGGLWRDEANTVGLATMPALHEVTANLQYDSFPMLWLLFIRGYSAVMGVMNDFALRALGFCVGAGMIAALWFAFRTFGRSVPIFSLFFFAMNPNVIHWGDSMRAYGFGMVLSLTSGALLWRFINTPTRWSFALAAFAAICSVQALFYNAVLLLCYCAGAAVVLIQRRAWRHLELVTLIGALAAISLVPYSSAMQAASNWNALVRMKEYTLPWFATKVAEAVAPAGLFALPMWLLLLTFAVITGTAMQFIPSKFGILKRHRETILFWLVALAVGIPSYYVFLKLLRYATNAWYYLSLMALAATALDIIFGAIATSEPWKAVRVISAGTTLALIIFPTAAAAPMRMTNLDVVASRLREVAARDDVILVTCWQCGITFQRYYRGTTPWMTVPPLSGHRFHRYDLLKEDMMQKDQTLPVQPVMDKVRETLSKGHRVFVVGGLSAPPKGMAPPILPTAPDPAWGWVESPYTAQYLLMVGYFIQNHGLRQSTIPLPFSAQANNFEQLPIFVFEGWRP